MKVCETCGVEIAPAASGFYNNAQKECAECAKIGCGPQDVPAFKKARAKRKEREQALRDLGLVKVRGKLGGTYWE